MEKPCLRLCRAGDFQLLFKQGRSLASPGLVLYFMPNQQVESRVAFCVGKNMGNAVTRNRTRRRMKEAFRNLQGKVTCGHNLAWVARKRTIELEFPLLIRQMEVLLLKAELMKED